MRSHRFNEEQPVSLRVKKYDIRQLIVMIDRHANPCELVAIINHMLFRGITHVKDCSAWSEAGSKILEDGHLKRVVRARRKVDDLAVGKP